MDALRLLAATLAQRLAPLSEFLGAKLHEEGAGGFYKLEPAGTGVGLRVLRAQREIHATAKSKKAERLDFTGG